MTKYSGEMTMNYWIEADNIKDADNKLDAMLDRWDIETPKEITWENWDRLIEEEKETEN